MMLLSGFQFSVFQWPFLTTIYASTTHVSTAGTFNAHVFQLQFLYTKGGSRMDMEFAKRNFTKCWQNFAEFGKILYFSQISEGILLLQNFLSNFTYIVVYFTIKYIKLKLLLFSKFAVLISLYEVLAKFCKMYAKFCKILVKFCIHPRGKLSLWYYIDIMPGAWDRFTLLARSVFPLV
jgi:hypothetical protein